MDLYMKEREWDTQREWNIESSHSFIQVVCKREKQDLDDKKSETDRQTETKTQRSKREDGERERGRVGVTERESQVTAPFK